jgi:hypothetical protein
MRPHGLANLASLVTLSLYVSQSVTQELPPGLPLQYASTAPGVAVTNGTKLRIFPVGDSITMAGSSLKEAKLLAAYHTPTRKHSAWPA